MVIFYKQFINRISWFISAFQNVVAAPKAKQAAAPPAAQQTGLQELAANVQAGVNNVTTVLQGNLPDSKDVVNKLSESAQTLATRVQEAATKLKAEVSLIIFN